MKFFEEVLTLDQLKSAYRRLVLMYHPDRGGDNEQMKQLNYEYSRRLKKLSTPPASFRDLSVGHIIRVNNSDCVVTEVLPECFKARSTVTGREAWFSKTTGYAMLNFRFRARL